MNCRCCDPQSLTVDYCDLCAAMRADAEDIKRKIERHKEDLRRLLEIHLEHHTRLTAARSAPIEDRLSDPPKKSLRKFLLGT